MGLPTPKILIVVEIDPVKAESMVKKKFTKGDAEEIATQILAGFATQLPDHTPAEVGITVRVEEGY